MATGRSPLLLRLTPLLLLSQLLQLCLSGSHLVTQGAILRLHASQQPLLLLHLLSAGIGLHLGLLQTLRLLLHTLATCLSAGLQGVPSYNIGVSSVERG